jgi:hypothetical protein
MFTVHHPSQSGNSSLMMKLVLELELLEYSSQRHKKARQQNTKQLLPQLEEEENKQVVVVELKSTDSKKNF